MSDPETLAHIQSTLCALQKRVTTSVHHHCWEEVQREITVTSPEMMMILFVYYHTNFMVYSRDQMNEN